MKRTLFNAALVFGVAIAASGSVSAKGPTVKITIAGGDLARPLELADAAALRDFDVWSGHFIDWAAGAPPEPASSVRPYEVSFYAKGNSGARLVYVVNYCPNPSAGRGSIYLPGRGDQWYSLNISTIWRGGRDGKWHHASHAWDDLIRPLISANVSGRSSPER